MTSMTGIFAGDGAPSAAPAPVGSRGIRPFVEAVVAGVLLLFLFLLFQSNGTEIPARDGRAGGVVIASAAGGTPATAAPAGITAPAAASAPADTAALARKTDEQFLQDTARLFTVLFYAVSPDRGKGFPR